MNDKNYDKKEVDLTEEEIDRIKINKAEFELQRDNLSISVEGLRKQIELDLLMRTGKAQLKDMELDLKRIKNNIEVYEKQITTKKSIQLIPKSKVK